MTFSESAVEVDTELVQLNISEELRANSSFMKIIAALFHYGNHAMDAAQLVIAVETLDLLSLPKKTPHDVIQEIISTSRRIARELEISDPFRIEDEYGVQLKYAISDDVINGVKTPDNNDIPMIITAKRGTKRQRKQTIFYTPQSRPRQKQNKKRSQQQKQPIPTILLDFDSSDLSEFEDVQEDFDPTIIPENQEDLIEIHHSYDDDDDDEYIDNYVKEDVIETEDKNDDADIIKEDSTIEYYSLLSYPPRNDMDYIDSINFTDYPTASHFAIVQQKGYSYPRFRSHEKTKIPKIQCEDKFRVTDILKDNLIIGRLFILADGHGGSGCSEYFVRKTPLALNAICRNYDIHQLDDAFVQKKLHDDIKTMIQSLDDDYLALKRQQIHSRTSLDERIDNDGCTLILNIFLGDWLINVNVGDSRTVLVSAPEPTPNRQIKTNNLTGINSEYKMDVVFASQDHKPYLEHLARHILENGGEFVDSAHKRVIKVQLDKLRDDGKKSNKRGSLKKARIRPKQDQGDDDTVCRAPTLNVARSCGDLDFKMNEERKIISCEPDITFIRISSQPQVNDKKKKRHFLFMSTDGTFDYMFEEIPEQQNRAIARVMGPMIEDGEKAGRFLLEQDFLASTCSDDEKIKNATVRIISECDPQEKPRVPLLHRELTDEESKVRTIKERTLVSSARYFADREGCHGFFAPTTQNYDDCTIILVEI